MFHFIEIHESYLMAETFLSLWPPLCDPQVEQYEASAEPLDGKTFYSQEFTPKQLNPEPMVRQKARRDIMNRDSATFDDTTTNKQHFKRWVPQPSLTFGELPSFTGR